MISESKTLNSENNEADRLSNNSGLGESYNRPVNADVNMGSKTNYQPNAIKDSIKSSNSQPVIGGMNPMLQRALIGGLIGTTLGALAGKRVSQGFNHAFDGLGKAFGTIGQGLGETAKGLGEAAKSVGQGVGYAVVGGASEATQNIAHGAQQVVASSTSAAQGVVAGVGQAIESTTGLVKEAAEATKQSAADVGDSIKGTISDVDEAINSNMKEQSSIDSAIEFFAEEQQNTY